MEFDPYGGRRANTHNYDRGVNLPEPVHLTENTLNSTSNYPQSSPTQGNPCVSPPTYVPVNHGAQDTSPSTKDDSKPTHALDLGHGEDAAGSEGCHVDRKWTRKRIVVPVAILLTLVAIGAVLGGVLGTMLTTNRSSSDNSPYFSPRSGDSIVGTNSNLATTFSGSVQILIAQTDDGDLMAVEFRGPKTDGYLIKDHTHGVEIPKALTDTPIELLQFGSESHLHLFYFDDSFRLAHLVRANEEGHNIWVKGAMSQVKLPYRPNLSGRLSAGVMSSEWTESGDSFLMVMYQTDQGSDTMVLLSSSEPDNLDNWSVHSFKLESDTHDAPLKKDSPGFLILPTTREANGEIKPAVRILWDPSDEGEIQTLGSLECRFSEESEMTDCDRTKNDWISSSEIEDTVLSAPKPLTLSATTLSTDINGTSTWLVNIVDANGNLTELRGTDSEWTEAQPLKVDPDTLPTDSNGDFTFSSARNANEDLLYTVVDGKLMEFGRIRGEDDANEANWEFLRVIETES